MESNIVRYEAPGPNRKQFQPDRVVVINDLSVLKGGATSIALSSALLISKRNIPVTVISGDDASTRLPDPNIKHEGVGSSHILEGPRRAAAIRGIYNAKSRKFLSDWIAQHDTSGTVYHVHGWSKILSPSIFSALAPVASRLVIHAHDYFLICPNGGYYDFRSDSVCERIPLGISCLTRNCDRRSYGQKVWRTVRAMVMRSLFRAEASGVVVPVHDGMIPLLAKGGIPSNCMRVLRNPVVPWRTEKVAAQSNTTFLYVGRLEDDKGAYIIARAATLAGVKLRMIGQGPLSERIAAEFPDVELLGWRNRQEISELCRDARVVVMPSLWRETFGLVAFEAMLSGIPVLVSDRVMIAQEVVKNRCGISVDPSDHNAVVGELIRLAGDDELVADLSENAWRKARNLTMNDEQWADRLLDIYGEVLSRAANGRSIGIDEASSATSLKAGVVEEPQGTV